MDLGAKPAVFYFALLGHESLFTDPFNQPVKSWEKAGFRIFSSTLPLHEASLKHTDAMSRWAKAMENGQNIVKEFVEKCQSNLDFLIDRNLVTPGKIACTGLSRGALLATHFAAIDPRIDHILGFAPLTNLNVLKEFESLQNNPIVLSANLENIVEKLVNKRIRFYIGNRDTRVTTDACYQFIRKAADAQFNQKVRSPKVELIISPSIGNRGHGTSLNIFIDGAKTLFPE